MIDSRGTGRVLCVTVFVWGAVRVAEEIGVSRGMRKSPLDFRLSLSFRAMDGGRVLGVSLNHFSREREEGNGRTSI